MAGRSFRDLIDEKIGSDLAAIGARFLEETRVDSRHKSVCFFAVAETNFEIEDSYHDGLNCRIERYSDTGNRADFETWATLWELGASQEAFPLHEQIRRDPRLRSGDWPSLGRALRIHFIAKDAD